MQFLVSAKWIEGEAKERGMSATPAEVERQFEQTKDQSFPNEKAYQRFLKTSGQTEEDLKFRVRLDVLSNKIRQQVTEESQNVSDSEIEKYYNDNEQQFSQPERRDLEVILTKKQAKALEAKRRVEGGEKWSAVAKDLSDRPRLQGAGRQAARRHEGPAGPEVRRGRLRRRREEDRRPDQDRRRLLRLPGHQGHEGLEAEPRGVQAGHQAAARLAEAAEGAGPVLHQLPQRVARAHRLREGLRDRRLPQRP